MQRERGCTLWKDDGEVLEKFWATMDKKSQLDMEAVMYEYILTYQLWNATIIRQTTRSLQPSLQRIVYINNQRREILEILMKILMKN